MDSVPCAHGDVREFAGLRSCLACGETRFHADLLQDQAASGVDEKEYLYTDLRCLETGRTIRLVVLEPGENDDPIRCSIHLAGLQYSDYEAVSYTWATEDGDDKKTRPIRVDGSTVLVTYTCEAALRQLRRPQSSRRLWIDVLCIDQKNVKERNHQVGLMDSIYRLARQVNVCICDQTMDYPDLFQWLAIDPEQSQPNGPAISQLRHLFKRRYFNRVWVIQEVVLAKSLWLHVNAYCTGLSPKMISNIIHVCMFSKVKLPGPLEALRHREASQNTKHLLRASTNASCSDPRDKIFAILSIIDPATRKLIQVDYSMSTQEVYTDAVLACIASTNSLDILSLAALDGNSLAMACSFKIEQLHSYLCSHKSCDWWFRPHPVAWTEKVYSNVAPYRMWKLDWPLPTSQILPLIRIRAHRVDVCKEMKDWDLLCWENLQGSALVQDDGAPGSWSTDEYTSDLIYKNVSGSELRTKIGAWGQVMFYTEHGVGRSAKTALPGDCVYFLDGLRVPLLLRPLQGPRFRIVGRCFWMQFATDHHPFPESIETIEVY